MHTSKARRAADAALWVARTAGLAAEEAVVLQSSNRLTLRLLPGDVLAQVAPAAQQVAAFELELAQQLLARGAPVAAPDPRVEPRAREHDGFVVTLWTYHEPVSRPSDAAEYADALARLHAGLREVDAPAPHLTERVDQAQRLVASREDTPALADPDRELLAETLRGWRRRIGEHGRPEQLLHGEPHPGNVLTTSRGLLFVDLETCCRGPVEFDLAHVPDDVGEHYPGADPALLRGCRVLVLAMITTWRWDRRDQLPDGRRLGREWLQQLRAEVTRTWPDPLPEPWIRES